MADEIARARALLARATPGPWRHALPGPGGYDSVVGPGPRGPVLAEVGGFDDATIGLDGPTARAIALLGSVWPELLAVAEYVGGPYHRCCEHVRAGEHLDGCPVPALFAALREHLPEEER